tara:strand:- start:26205 stop:26411 length:207 start_codon:yes stop_codon:yes gene_type:complete
MNNCAQVLFINTLYQPTEYELRILNNMQVEIFFCHAQIEYEENGDQYNIMLRKQMLADKMRESIHIVK